MVVTLHDVDIELAFRRRHEYSLVDAKLGESACVERGMTDLLNTWPVELSKRAHDPCLVIVSQSRWYGHRHSPSCLLLMVHKTRCEESPRKQPA